MHEGHPSLPPLHVLGLDLLRTSWPVRLLVLAAPFVSAALYFVLALHGHWVPAVFAVAFLSFITYGSTSHDLVHGNLGLPPVADDILLAIIELLALRSGHAYRISHLAHHRLFPTAEDAEGAPARWGLLWTLLVGPIYIIWLWGRSWRHAHSRERAWIAGETLAVVLYVLTATALRRAVPVLAVYAGLVYVASWVFPLGLVYVQHDAHGKDAAFQTRWFHGHVVPALLLHHLYHLEHHLYPMVPAHQWRTLARRLRPHLEALGVQAIDLP
jgi:beta-carotene hydroxylase